MDGRELLRTTGSVRQFTDEPVDDALLHAVLDDARFAPSGGNRQAWRVVVVKDLALRRRLGDLMRPVWDEYVEISASGVTPFSAVAPSVYERPPTARGAVLNPVIEAIETVPVVLVVGADLGSVAMMDKDLDRPPLVGGASIYPFCWNVLLAARCHGLGGVLTTFLSRAEPQAATDLGLPPTFALAATIFLGHPVHQPTKLRRRAVSEFTTLDRFDGPSFAPQS
jgi:nitroreductase